MRVATKDERMTMMIGLTPCGGSMQGKPQSGQESVNEELELNGIGL